MSRLKTLFIALAASQMLIAVPAHAKERTGVVTAMEPIENRGADETEGTKKKRSIGTSLGGLAGTIAGVKVKGPVGMAAIRYGPKLGAKAGVIGDDPESTQYMVTVKMDDGKTLNLARYRVNLEGVDVGTRVLVRGKGSEASIEPIGDAAPQE